MARAVRRVSGEEALSSGGAVGHERLAERGATRGTQVAEPGLAARCAALGSTSAFRAPLAPASPADHYAARSDALQYAPGPGYSSIARNAITHAQGAESAPLPKQPDAQEMWRCAGHPATHVRGEPWPG